MKTYRIALPLLVALVLPLASASAQDGRTYRSELQSFRVVTIAQGLDHPWSLAFLPDGRKLVTERAGRLRIIGADGKLQPDAVQGVPKVVARGQGGLLDVALHPRFAQNALIYLSYAEAGEGGQGTAVMRARLVGDGGNAHLEDQRVLREARMQRDVEQTALPARDHLGHAFHRVGLQLAVRTDNAQPPRPLGHKLASVRQECERPRVIQTPRDRHDPERLQFAAVGASILR